MSDFEIQVQSDEDSYTLACYMAEQEYHAEQARLVDEWFEEMIDDANAELQCASEVNR